MIPGKERVYVRLFYNPQYVHCVGSDSITALDKLIWKVDVLPEEKDEKNIDPSFFRVIAWTKFSPIFFPEFS